MPYVVAWLASYIIEAGVTSTALATTIAAVVVDVAISLAVSEVTQLLAGKPSGTGDPPQRIQTARGTTAYRQLVYGQIKTGGFLAYIGTSGPNNDILWFVIVVAGHEVTAIDDVWLDSRHLSNSDIDPSTGQVLAAAFNHAGPRLQIEKFLGGTSSVADAQLTAACPEWDSSHIGFGVAYVVYQLARDAVVWPSGAPSNFYALVKGRKLYDPRLDSTNGGSGSHRFTNPSTWAWSQNWALACRDYQSGGAVYYSSGTPDKRLGLGEADARIDDSYIIAAANHADEVVTVPLPVLAGTTNWTNGSAAITGNGTLFTDLSAGDYLLEPVGGAMFFIASITDDTHLTLSSPYGGATLANEITHWNTSTATSTTELRFTADAQLSCGNTHRENINILLSAGNGHWTYAGGLWRLFAGVYSTPTITLTADDVLGPLRVLTHDPGDQVWNYVDGQFFDENNGWAQMPFPAQQNSTYETDDGRQYPKSIDLQATRGVYRAQRLAQVVLQQGRNMLTCDAQQLSQSAMQLNEWDNFFLTIPEYNWTAQIFRVVTWKLLSSGYVAMQLRSESAAAYTDLAVAAYVDPSTNNPPAFVLDTPSAPGALTAVGLVGKIGFVVGLPIYFPSGQTIEIWEYASNSPFSSAAKVLEGRTGYLELPKPLDTTTRYYWATTHDPNGGRSTNYPSGAGVAGAAILEPTGQIAPNAATVIAIANSSGSGTVSSPAGWTDFGILIGAGGAAPAFDCTVIVTCTLLLSQQSGSPVLSVAASFADNVSTFVRGPVTALQVNAAAQAVTVQAQFSHLASNAAGGYLAGFSIFNSGSSVSLVEGQSGGGIGLGNAQVEFIQR